MRKLIIVFLLFSLCGHGQLLQQRSVPRIHMTLVYKNQVVHQPIIFSYVPRHLPIKFTIKPMVNKANFAYINYDALERRDLDDAFDNVDFLGFGKFDTRIKIYVNKKARIIMRAVFRNNNGTLYTIGLRFKV